MTFYSNGDHVFSTEERHEGIAVCTVCNGGEGSLPTDCPERPMTAEEQDEVYKGMLNFHRGPMDHKGGFWWRKVIP